MQPLGLSPPPKHALRAYSFCCRAASLPRFTVEEQLCRQRHMQKWHIDGITASGYDQQQVQILRRSNTGPPYRSASLTLRVLGVANL